MTLVLSTGLVTFAVVGSIQFDLRLNACSCLATSGPHNGGHGDKTSTSEKAFCNHFLRFVSSFNLLSLSVVMEYLHTYSGVSIGRK